MNSQHVTTPHGQAIRVGETIRFTTPEREQPFSGRVIDVIESLNFVITLTPETGRVHDVPTYAILPPITAATASQG